MKHSLVFVVAVHADKMRPMFFSVHVPAIRKPETIHGNHCGTTTVYRTNDLRREVADLSLFHEAHAVNVREIPRGEQPLVLYGKPFFLRVVPIDEKMIGNDLIRRNAQAGISRHQLVVITADEQKLVERLYSL